jgi:8-oxo-dGTP pyrophosphatase MutT (NUDIX family)
MGMGAFYRHPIRDRDGRHGPPRGAWDARHVRTISSREVYRNAWMSVREDHVVREDGSTGNYGVVDKPDFGLVIPREADRFWLVEQFRYPVGRRAWEFPQGSWGSGAGGSAVELARAELAEETGLAAGQLRRLGHLYEAYGFCSQGFDVYLATDLHHGEVAREPSERDMRHRSVTEREFQRMVRGGDIVDGASLAAYTLLQLDHI